MFGNPIVGLLTCVGDSVYRFSHLTLQEYLAARCAVRLFGHDAKELLKSVAAFTFALETDGAAVHRLHALGTGL